MPDAYASDRLNLKLTNQQIEILYSVKDNRRTAVKAHHSLGKTFIAAVDLLWWLDCWASHIGYITAPTWGQALGLTFKQAKRLAIQNKLDFQILNSGIIRDWDEYVATERFIKALNAANGEGFQGEHTAPILIVVEEAVGVPNYIFDAMEGLMTDPRCRVLEIANPTDDSTLFGDHCDSPSYTTFSFSALDHPNITAELNCLEIPFPGAISLLWLYEKLENECDVIDSGSGDAFEFYNLDVIYAAINGFPVPPVYRNEDGTINHRRSNYCYYKPNAFFQGRVLGEFPTEASNKVIPAGWIKSLPDLELNSAHQIQIGVDTARFGDDRTTIFSRIGSIALSGVEVRQFDSLNIVSQIKDVLQDLGKQFNLNREMPLDERIGVQMLRAESAEKKIKINIDVTGGLGTGPLDILKSEGYNAVGINSSESPKDKQLYKNKRSELWFDIRDRAKIKNLDISRLPPDIRRKLIKELSTPMYKIRGGKKVVEEKDETKKRLGESPDLADGFNLSFYEPITMPDVPLFGSYVFN